MAQVALGLGYGLLKWLHNKFSYYFGRVFFCL